MSYLTDFVDWLNNDVGGEGPLPNLQHGSYGEAMGQSLKRHYEEDRQRGGVRMSNVGKPAAILALAQLGYAEPEPKGKSRYIFHTGDMFENWLEVMLLTYGIEIIESQPEYKHLGITGHADYVVRVPGQKSPIVVEAKTMSDNYTRQFSREADDNRGYLSQLAMYSAASGLPATWICINKGNSEVFERVPDPDAMYAAVVRAEKVIKNVAQVKTLEDVLKYAKIPPARPEQYRKQLTGRFIVPQSLSYSPFRSALYELELDYNSYRKPTEYVVRQADTAHMMDELEKLVELGVITKA